MPDPDHVIRRAALEHVRGLARRYDDLVPRSALLEGFTFAGERWRLGSRQNGDIASDDSPDRPR